MHVGDPSPTSMKFGDLKETATTTFSHLYHLMHHTLSLPSSCLRLVPPFPLSLSSYKYSLHQKNLEQFDFHRPRRRLRQGSKRTGCYDGCHGEGCDLPVTVFVGVSGQRLTRLIRDEQDHPQTAAALCEY